MDRYLLPGFGRPLNYDPQEGDPDFIGPLFPSALSSVPGVAAYVSKPYFDDMAPIYFLGRR